MYGLFPEDYHSVQLNTILDKFRNDSLGKAERLDAALWSRADLLLTDAFIQAVKDVTGVTPTYLRPPYGDTDNRVRAIAKACGLKSM